MNSAAREEGPALVVILALLWWCWPGMVSVTDDFGAPVIIVVVRYVVTGLLSLVALAGCWGAYIRVLPFWRMAWWVQQNEVSTGQLPLFPHRYRHTQPTTKELMEGMYTNAMQQVGITPEAIEEMVYHMAQMDRTTTK